MDGPNNVNSNYVRPFTGPYQLSYLSSNNANPPLIHQFQTQNFLPSVSDNVDEMFMNIMDYKDTRNYTGDYASIQDNPSVPHFHLGNVNMMNGQLNSPQLMQTALAHSQYLVKHSVLFIPM
ncbi:7399_t:CDS:1 [Paraglomus occultum]|uniref:7399_t:CDS:1 n=1 Tax=Paraglomus occultum TaxID=144539 RepID=A0A9N9BVZ3_9GLOM|nr:7399_t:CDS:1 [Paraglomus occultum]